MHKCPDIMSCPLPARQCEERHAADQVWLDPASNIDSTHA